MGTVNEDEFEQLVPVCEEAARPHGVVPDIHRKDFLFHFLIQNRSFPNTTRAVHYYFDDGARSAEKLSRLLQEFRADSDSKFKMLEFASGYGCVTRHLAHFLPNADVTSCDIHPEAVDFIENRLGVPAILSNSVPKNLRASSRYDVVFALSFFSHMPRHTWLQWLLALLSKLEKDGLLILTTHGMESRKWFGFPEIDPDGFWFNAQSEQHDLDTEGYGQTIVLPHFVFGELRGQTDTRIIMYREASWWEHQDLYVLRRT